MILPGTKPVQLPARDHELAGGAMIPLLLVLLMSASGSLVCLAQQSLPNRSVTQNGIKVILQKITAISHGNRVSLGAEFRITDTSGRSLPLIKNLVMTQVETKKSSMVGSGAPGPAESSRANPIITGIPANSIARMHTLLLEFFAAKKLTACVWKSIPVLSPAAAGKLPVLRSGTLEMQVVTLRRENRSELIGNRLVPTLIAELDVYSTDIAARTDGGSFKVEASTRFTLEESWRSLPGMTRYTCIARPISGEKLPDHVSLRFYTPGEISASLKRYSFTFRNLSFQGHK